MEKHGINCTPQGNSLHGSGYWKVPIPLAYSELMGKYDMELLLVQVTWYTHMKKTRLIFTTDYQKRNCRVTLLFEQSIARLTGPIGLWHALCRIADRAKPGSVGPRPASISKIP
jgi:hypothetical protein